MTYATILNISAATAAKKYNVDAADIRHHYRNFKQAPKTLKPALILFYKIKKNYEKKLVAQPA